MAVPITTRNTMEVVLPVSSKEAIRFFLLIRLRRIPKTKAPAAPIPPASIEILEENIDHYFKTHDKNTRESLNFEFHRILGQICGNPFYAMLTNSIMDFTYNFLRVITPKWKMLHNDSDHREIFLAIKERNPEKAMVLLRDHILRIVEEMRRLEKKYSRLRDKGDKEASDHTG
jgi:DNA-binding FadR family transcriptional regulator